MTKMTKEQFEDLLRSYGFVNNGNAVPRGPQWWTYGGYNCDNNAFLINKNGTAFIYPSVEVGRHGNRFLQFGRSKEYEQTSHSFASVARLVPKLAEDIKTAIKSIRREAIDRL